MQVGADTGSGMSFSNGTFDDAYSEGSYLRCAYGLFSKCHMRELRLYDKVLTTTQIDENIP